MNQKPGLSPELLAGIFIMGLVQLFVFLLGLAVGWAIFS